MEHKIKQIADRIRELRIITGLSVEEMAELLIARYGIDKELAMKDSSNLCEAWVNAGIAE